MRRHGWQRPLHTLQIVGMSVFCFLLVAFYCFFGLLLGNRVAEITLTSVYSFVAISAAFLFIRCAAIDPTDRTRFKMKRKSTRTAFSNVNYGFVLGQIVVRFIRRIERRVLKTFIRRKYLDPFKSNLHLEPLLTFPLLVKDDLVAPQTKDDDISFCSLCDFEVKKRSKHCRTCNRCVEGFDHHCRWLNNCVGKKNYTSFIFLMIFLLIMLLIEGGTAAAIFVRCFANKRSIELEIQKRFNAKFPRGVLATICAVLFFMTSYCSAALGQLFLFHIVLIRKGMRTYDYILAMREENQSTELLESSEDSDSSDDESIDFDSPEKASLISKLTCREKRMNQSLQTVSIKIDGETESSTLKEKRGFRANIDPWKLISMSREKALQAAEKAKERLIKQEIVDPLKPLPLETRSGPLMNLDTNRVPLAMVSSRELALSKEVITTKGRLIRGGGSPMQLASPRRRHSYSPTVVPTPCSGNATVPSPSPKHRYRGNFDLKLTQVSRELETYISRQVLYSALKKENEIAASPR
ncbi:Protein S-acyltransferase 18 [Capsicum annuum]|uniref:protein S-acyltransferase 18 n=1 Tax=Capsicum annuum TaxID=4072 RepID=UPI001FB160F3|nr:protein S-acyltransferase 18 [Capsicum annuum]KAF3621475.1 Protein S-acyltransferase 18 [Capsicum annuum]KAF3633644.1 Protein S-acyltransferase 18 [Capsicum annuum]